MTTSYRQAELTKLAKRWFSNIRKECHGAVYLRWEIVVSGRGTQLSVFYTLNGAEEFARIAL